MFYFALILILKKCERPATKMHYVKLVLSNKEEYRISGNF